jgi:hypothetical protein
VEVRGFEPLTPCMPSTEDMTRRIIVNAERSVDRYLRSGQATEDRESSEKLLTYLLTTFWGDGHEDAVIALVSAER